MIIGIRNKNMFGVIIFTITDFNFSYYSTKLPLKAVVDASRSLDNKTRWLPGKDSSPPFRRVADEATYRQFF